jgi:serine/threonine-protein kinase
VLAALEKVPADRFASAADFAMALERPGSFAFTVPVSRAGPAGPGGRLRVAAIGALILGAALAGNLLGRRAARAPGAGARPMVQFGIELPPEAGLAGGIGSTIALAPDGSRLAYVGARRLYVRGLAQIDPAPVAGSDAGALPFFAPDGQSLGFVQNGRLVRVALAGGPVLTICTAPGDVLGATWTTRDTILFASDSGVYDVPAQGGTPRLIARPARRERLEWPDILPDERYALLTSVRGDTVKLAVLDRRAGTVDRLGTTGAYPRYVRAGFITLNLPPGHLVAVPFDAARRTVTGGAIPIIDIFMGADGDANIGVSRSGDFAYQTSSTQPSHLVLIDRRGVARDIGRDTAGYAGPRLSPDGRRVAVGRTTGSESDLWTIDLATGAADPVPGGTGALWPFWDPDGDWLVYQKAGVDVRGVARIPADGSSPARTVLNGPWLPWTFDRSGALLYYGADSGQSGRFVIRRMPLDHPESSQVVIRAPFFMIQPRVSTDGRWIAYTSSETGRREVFVSAYPGPGAKTQISQGGGEQPLWSDRGEIIYRNGANIMAATIRVRDRVEVVSRAVRYSGPTEYNFDMSPDGSTLVMLGSVRSSNSSVIVTLNWFDQLGTRRGQ